MKNDEREQLERRVNDQWARRMRALEREFARADRARQAAPARHSIPMAILSGAVVILTAVVILLATRGGNHPKPVAQPVPPGVFGTSPAANWRDADNAIALPAPVRTGSFSADAVRAALARVRTSIVATRTGAAFLAPGNRLAAAVRADGVMTYRHMARSAHSPEQLVVSVNVVWAYALNAAYPVAPGPDDVVAVHERAEFRFAAGEDPATAKARPAKDVLLWWNADCGRRSAGLLGLPRANDPAALPGYSNGVSVDQAFALATTDEITGHICR